MKIVKTIIKDQDGQTEIYELPNGLIEAIIGVCNAQMDILKMQKELASGIMAETTGQPQHATTQRDRADSPIPPQRNVQIDTPKGRPTRTDIQVNRTIPNQRVAQPSQIQNVDEFYNFYSNILKEEESEDGYQYKSEDFNV
jgi:hypothetical protein